MNELVWTYRDDMGRDDMGRDDMGTFDTSSVEGYVKIAYFSFCILYYPNHCVNTNLSYD